MSSTIARRVTRKWRILDGDKERAGHGSAPALLQPTRRPKWNQSAVAVAAALALLVTGASAAHAEDDSATSSAEAVSTLQAIEDATPAAILESTADPEVLPDGTTVTEDSSGGVISIPASGAASVEITSPSGQEVGFSVTDVPGDAQARVSDGLTVFDLGDHSVTFQPVSEADGGGVRTLFTIENPEAPTSFKVDYDLPSGARFSTTAGGGFIVYDEANQPIGAVPAPWAKDANGQAISTEYELVGNSLIQHVHTTPETAFPVVADPFWIPAWAVVQIIRCGAGGLLGYISAAGWQWYWRALAVVGGCLIGVR